MDITRGLSWIGIVRLGLVQASIGAVVVFVTSTLNRVMVVELALPAIVPGALVAIHYAVQMLRPRWGYGSDRGGRRTPWIIGGMTCLAAGGVVAALATAWMKSMPVAGVALALAGFVMIGIGVGAAGTSLLVVLAKHVDTRRRAAAATVVWTMMIAGFIVTAGVAGHLLDPFSTGRLVAASAAIAGGALLVTVLAVWGVEPAETDAVAAPAAAVARRGFSTALREVWAEPAARRFTLFVFLSMLAYSAQELIVEPFVGTVFGLSPAESARLAGLQHTGLLGGMVIVALLGSAVGGPRLGSMRLWTVAGCLASALAVLCLAAVGVGGGIGPLRVSIVALGLANGAFSIAAVAAMMQLAGSGPPGREGVRMGLWGAAQALAFALGGLLGTGASDLARHVFGTPAFAYTAIFIGEAVLFCLAAGLAARAFPSTAGASLRGGTSAVLAQPSPEAQRWAT